MILTYPSVALLRDQVYLNLEPGNIIVCSGRSLGKTVQVKVSNFETAQTVSKSGTQIKCIVEGGDRVVKTNYNAGRLREA